MEHQVVFESIRFLLSRGTLTAARLAVHLNNRGFPDVDMEKYFPQPRPRIARGKNSRARRRHMNENQDIKERRIRQAGRGDWLLVLFAALAALLIFFRSSVAAVYPRIVHAKSDVRAL